MYNKEKLSKADYSSRNVAPLIEFFTPIVKKILPPKQSSEGGSFNPPSDDCWVHFDGTFVTGMSTFIIDELTAIRDAESIQEREIRKTLQTADIVGNGSISNNASIILPNAVRTTFDSLAVAPNVRLEITLNNSIILDVYGPKVIYNKIWVDSDLYRLALPQLMTSTWDRLDHKGNPWEDTFPPSTRVISETNMHSWSGGVIKITCPEGTSPPSPTILNGDYNIAFKYKYYYIRHFDPLGVTPHPKGYFYVQHPHLIGDLEYQTSLPKIESKELKEYEEKAKKSKRLERWKKENNVQYDYFL